MLSTLPALAPLPRDGPRGEGAAAQNSSRFWTTNEQPDISLHATQLPIPSSACSVLAPGEKELRPEEQSLLDRICEAYYLPTWCSVADYQRLFEAEGLTGGREGSGDGFGQPLHAGPRPPPVHPRSHAPALPAHLPTHHLPTHPPADIKTADWSEEVAPFWGEVIKSAFTSEGISGLLKAGWTTIKGALVGVNVGHGGARQAGACLEWLKDVVGASRLLIAGCTTIQGALVGFGRAAWQARAAGAFK